MNENTPPTRVVVWYRVPVGSWTAVRLAPSSGIAAASVTTPSIPALVTPCPNAVPLRSIVNARARSVEEQFKRRNLISGLLEGGWIGAPCGILL
jgi:hypothetical protein